MNREIKFRVFDNDTNKMYYTAGLTVCNNSVTHVNGHVMQFTGLKDRNGKEIYEGDILKYLKYKYYKDYGQSGELVDMPNILVKWVESKARFDPLSYWTDYDEQLKTCEVIGNIHQDKHLIS